MTSHTPSRPNNTKTLDGEWKKFNPVKISKKSGKLREFVGEPWGLAGPGWWREIGARVECLHAHFAPPYITPIPRGRLRFSLKFPVFQLPHGRYFDTPERELYLSGLFHPSL